MALQCQMQVNASAYQAGGSPPPQATLVVYNPGASAVSVTGVELTYSDDQGASVRPSVPPSVPPIGPGLTTSVPAASSISIGPFPLAFATVAACNSFQSVPPGAVPANSQGSQPAQQSINVGALVYGSDGSVNVAGSARVLVSSAVPPPLGYQGGFAHFSAPNNAALVAAGVG